MTKFLFKTLIAMLVMIASHHALAQTAAPTASATATASDVAALRQQVEALTGTVKELQQQVKDQQAALEKANIVQLPQGQGTSSAASAPLPTPLPGTSAQESFPTTDSSVVSNAPTAPGTPAGNENGTATGQFPPTDESVVATPAGAISSTTGAPPIETSTGSLTQPITIAGGGKNYMNISFDGMFALAGSSARDLSHIELSDNDPQQRGFNARNIELAFDGAVDPYFEGFANIVFKLDNDNQTEVEVEEAIIQTTNQ